MYRQIEAHLVLSGKTKREVADALGISYNTLLLKLKGASCFTLDEAVKLQTLLKAPESIEELFDKPA
ncbi:XRE family transcriptional regulator [Hydrogenoanaerobacterium sp.]|uniref:XRE family transcriptional regulator n=1 Tax=Hydrogenoanaerobacterium sp. TaxID=2953763 RepID=UPI00289E4CB4|nr:XRE family transcriptional regulator [Hydrogenoanaerobacterium sp.]